MKFNQKQQVFPSNIIADMFRFKKKEYFEIEEPAAKEPVKVQFLRNGGSRGIASNAILVP